MNLNVCLSKAILSTEGELQLPVLEEGSGLHIGLEPRPHGDVAAGQAVGPHWRTDGLDPSLFHPVVAHAGTSSAITKTGGEAAAVGCRPCAGLCRLSQEESHGLKERQKEETLRLSF